MNIKRTIIASLTLLGSILTGAAEDMRDCLLVHLSSGDKVAFKLDDTPIITFDGGVMTIATQRWQITDVRKYTIADYATSIVGNNADAETNGRWSEDGRYFCIHLNDRSAKVRMYTAGGIEVPLTCKADNDGIIRIDMSRMGYDIYLLTVGNETIKIRRR